jgi:hypothetical protein
VLLPVAKQCMWKNDADTKGTYLFKWKLASCLSYFQRFEFSIQMQLVQSQSKKTEPRFHVKSIQQKITIPKFYTRKFTTVTLYRYIKFPVRLPIYLWMNLSDRNKRCWIGPSIFVLKCFFGFLMSQNRDIGCDRFNPHFGACNFDRKASFTSLCRWPNHFG